MKNPHGVEPTRFMKKEKSGYAIKCDSISGPIFGSFDICIDDKNTEENSYYIGNNGKGGYECHPEYKSSLFVNTAEPDEQNNFSVLDYEVYTHN